VARQSVRDGGRNFGRRRPVDRPARLDAAAAFGYLCSAWRRLQRHRPAQDEKEDDKVTKNTSRIELASNVKSAMIQLLNARLADTLDLALLTKQAHWNLKGIQFIAVHEMLDGFRTEIDGHTDTIAERVAQLGGIALGTAQTVAEKTSLKPYPTDISSVLDHLNALTDRYAATANSIRSAIDAADEAGDKNTADIFTGVSRSLDKALWFLQSHLA
jgi:starvation-inducible DNA-binding protein